MTRKNPLFRVTAAETTAAAETPPKSEAGRPMQRVLCAGIPAWVDLENRLVIPVLS